jgi:hypothetical protein
MKHEGNLIITRANKDLFLELVEVTGPLYIRADAQLPALTTVGGYLYIRADAQLPALTTVGGYLYIRADAQLPALTTVGGYLYIRVGKLIAPALTTLHGNRGQLLATSIYGLWLSNDGYYFAGCRGPLSKDAALSHWNRSDERAKIFTAAIKANEVQA